MRAYVIDASVAAKWYFSENLHKEARRYLSPRYDQLAPNFLRLEFASILYKKEKTGEVDTLRTDAFLQHFLESDVITYFPTEGFLLRALRISREIGHPIYDCFYLDVAEREEAIVVTADRHFLNRVKSSHYAPLVVWVEFPPREEQTL